LHCSGVSISKFIPKNDNSQVVNNSELPALFDEKSENNIHTRRSKWGLRAELSATGGWGQSPQLLEAKGLGAKLPAT